MKVIFDHKVAEIRPTASRPDRYNYVHLSGRECIDSINVQHGHRIYKADPLFRPDKQIFDLQVEPGGGRVTSYRFDAKRNVFSAEQASSD